MSQVQTTSTPTPVATRYGNFGSQAMATTPDPSRMFIVLVGPGGSGKTNFAMSVPGILMCNADLSPPPRPSPGAPLPECQFFPGLGPDSQPIDSAGRPLLLQWEMFEDLRLSLIQAAEKNLPRPRAVCLDSTTAAMRLLQSYITRNARALNLIGADKAPPKEFWDLSGEAAYGRAYDMLINWAISLRQAGYGVFYIVHIASSVMQIGEDAAKRIWEPAGSPGAWKRIFPMADMVLPIRQLFRVTSERTTHIVNGQEVAGQPRTTSTPYYAMEFGNAELLNVVKRRVALPQTIELPASGAWSAFDAAYRAAYGAPTPTP